MLAAQSEPVGEANDGRQKLTRSAEGQGRWKTAKWAVPLRAAGRWVSANPHILTTAQEQIAKLKTLRTSTADGVLGDSRGAARQRRLPRRLRRRRAGGPPAQEWAKQLSIASRRLCC